MVTCLSESSESIIQEIKLVIPSDESFELFNTYASHWSRKSWTDLKPNSNNWEPLSMNDFKGLWIKFIVTAGFPLVF